MGWLALTIAVAALLVLVVVCASGLGPVRSLRASMMRAQESRDEIDAIRRGLDGVRDTMQRLHARRDPPA